MTQGTVKLLKLSASELTQLVTLSKAENGRLGYYSPDASVRLLKSLCRKRMCVEHRQDKNIVGWEITELGRTWCE